MTVSVDLLVFPDADLMDVTGPLEALLTANRLQQRGGRTPVFDTKVVGTVAGPISVFGGLAVIPQQTVAEHLKLADVVIVPGAVDLSRVRDAELAALIGRYAEAGSLVTSVCTGAFALAEAGLLADRPWTTHWEDVATLSQRVGPPDRSGARVVDAGEVITAGGLTCGIDLGLHLITKFADAELAAAVARQLDWPQPRP